MSDASSSGGGIQRFCADLIASPSPWKEGGEEQARECGWREGARERGSKGASKGTSKGARDGWREKEREIACAHAVAR